MGKNFMGYNNASELITAIGNKIKAKYSKPSGGIPKSDLATAVQTSLGKADSALQSYTETDPTVPSWAKQANKPTYTQDEVGDGSTYKRVSATEKTTWNNKGTYSKPSGGIPKTDLASAVQTSLGLADGSLQHTYVNGSPDLDTFTTTGVYHIATQTATHAPTTNHATLFVDATVGTPYQIFKPDSSDTVWYTRHRSGSSWTAWVAMKFTDTTYSAATTSAAGLMSATDKTKLNGIATGAQVNSITGVKGNAESSYRTGNVNLTPENIGLGWEAVSPSDFFTPSTNITIKSSTPLYKQGVHIFGLVGLKAMTTTPILGTVKTPYLPCNDTSGIVYVQNVDNILEPQTYIIRSDNGMILANTKWTAGSFVYFYVDCIIG